MILLRGGATVPTDPHIEGAGGGQLSAWYWDTKDRLDRSGDACGKKKREMRLFLVLS